MKKCSYCGKKFTDEAAVCDVDGQPLLMDIPAPAPAPAAPYPQPYPNAKKELAYVDPLRAAIVLGILYAILGLVFIPFMVLAFLFSSQFGGKNAFPMIFGSVFFAVMMPVMYGILGFIVGLIAAAVYNLIAKFTGGLKFEVRDA